MCISKDEQCTFVFRLKQCCTNCFIVINQADFKDYAFNCFSVIFYGKKCLRHNKTVKALILAPILLKRVK